MNEVTFLQNFKHVANAPDGVQRLRELVLQLAAMGRLVPRAASEGDAESLVAAISNERERLADEGGVRLASPLPAVDSGSQSVSVPDHWRWIRLGNLTSKIGSGSTPRGGSKVYVSDGVPFLRSQNIWNDGVRLDDVVFISAETHAKMRNTHVIPNDILLNITGASLGRCAIAPVDFPAANVSQHVTIIRPLLAETRHFLHICLLSPFGQGMIWGRQVGMAREGLSKKVLEQFEIPLPPLEEQKRIVAKVDELMRLCDRLEAQQQEREKLLPLLSRANHARFVTEPTTKSLTGIFQQQGAISPGDMRETVLSLAVRGLLAQQQPEDEPVDELLSRIQKQRAGYGSSDVEEVSSDEAFFAVPTTWRWVRLGNISTHSDSGWSPQCKETPRVGDEWGILKVSAVSWGRFLPEENKGLPASVNPRPECEVKDGDFLMSRANTFELVAKSVVVENPPPHLMLSDKIVRFHLPAEIDKSYINLFNLSPWARQYYAKNASGTSSSMKNVGRKVMSRLPIPFPPAEEQRRIVSRVRQFMSLIDRLEQLVNEKRNTAASFAKAAVASITSTEFTENERMKPPKTEVVTALKVGKKPKKPDAAPLATLLSEQKAEASAKTLWQLSGLEIDAFYRQLKTEMANGWIDEDKDKRSVNEVEAR